MGGPQRIVYDRVVFVYTISCLLIPLLRHFVVDSQWLNVFCSVGFSYPRHPPVLNCGDRSFKIFCAFQMSRFVRGSRESREPTPISMCTGRAKSNVGILEPINNPETVVLDGASLSQDPRVMGR